MVRSRHTAGQALIESCLVIGLGCLLLMGLFQLAHLWVAQELLTFAAARGARAKAVGFNDFMVSKTVRIGAIGTAGALRVPPPAPGGPWAQWTDNEAPRIPHYLEADAHELQSILDYELWDTLGWHCPAPRADVLDFHVSQPVPIMFFSNLFRAFFSGSSVRLMGSVSLDNHYPLYLE